MTKLRAFKLILVLVLISSTLFLGLARSGINENLALGSWNHWKHSVFELEKRLRILLRHNNYYNHNSDNKDFYAFTANDYDESTCNVPKCKSYKQYDYDAYEYENCENASC